MFFLAVIFLQISGCISFKVYDSGNSQKIIDINLVTLLPEQSNPTTLPHKEEIYPTNIIPNSDLLELKPTNTQIVDSHSLEDVREISTLIPPDPNSSPNNRTITDNVITPISTEDPEYDIEGKIVFICEIFRVDQRNQICLMNADGSDYKRISENNRSNYLDPVISPNGSNIIFAGNEGERFDLYEIDLAGNIIKLSSGPGNSYEPSISPDGDSILYTYFENYYRRIWKTNRDGSEPHQIFGPPQGEGWYPVWSPDGDQIMFLSGDYENPQIFVMEENGLNYRKITDFEGIFGRSDWSPDGNRITFSMGNPGVREIYLLDLDNNELIQLTEGGNNVSPSFSPDGGWIAFQTYRDNYFDVNGCEIYIIRIDGGELTRLTDNSYCDWKPYWGP